MLWAYMCWISAWDALVHPPEMGLMQSLMYYGSVLILALVGVAIWMSVWLGGPA